MQNIKLSPKPGVYLFLEIYKVRNMKRWGYTKLSQGRHEVTSVFTHTHPNTYRPMRACVESYKQRSTFELLNSLITLTSLTCRISSIVCYLLLLLLLLLLNLLVSTLQSSGSHINEL